MRVFISYSQDDRPQAVHLTQKLREINHEPWSDRGLLGGQHWWDKILENIRTADVVMVLISPSYLASTACRLEREYATRLGKQLLPVMVVHVLHHLLPSDLAPLQIVDYTQPTEGAAFAFTKAVGSVRPAPPLPNPLPPPPDIPLSYTIRLRDQISAQHALTLDQQMAIVSELEFQAATRDTEERRAIFELLEMLRYRGDLFEVTARRVQGILGQMQNAVVRTAPHPVMAPPRTVGNPRNVKVLAVVGGIAALFIVLLIVLLSAGSSEPECYQDVLGQVYCR